jgi:hypothetical protein
MHNVFHGWNFMTRMEYRRVCYKGTNPDDFNKPTEVEKSEAVVAVRNYNEYLKDKPVINAYLKDISRDPTETAQVVQGQASADLAQKAVFVPGNPNAGMSPAGAVKSAQVDGRVMSELGQDAIAQQAAAKKSYVENAMGIQSSANTAQQGMAHDAVARNTAEAEADYQSSAATASSAASLAGAGAAMVYQKAKK